MDIDSDVLIAALEAGLREVETAWSEQQADKARLYLLGWKDALQLVRDLTEEGALSA